MLSAVHCQTEAISDRITGLGTLARDVYLGEIKRLAIMLDFDRRWR